MNQENQRRATISIPSSEFAVGGLIISKSDAASVQKMVEIAKRLLVPLDEISNNYFENGI